MPPVGFQDTEEAELLPEPAGATPERELRAVRNLYTGLGLFRKSPKDSARESVQAHRACQFCEILSSALIQHRLADVLRASELRLR